MKTIQTESIHGCRSRLTDEIALFIAVMNEQALSYPSSKSFSYAQSRFNAEKIRQPFIVGGPTMSSTKEFTLSSVEGEPVLRIYKPNNKPKLPVLFYLHGGGWVLFSINTHDRLMREYAETSEICVIGIDYSLAPENKFPFQIHQICDVIQWCVNNSEELDIDPKKVFLGGDSAGANLTISCASQFELNNKVDLLNGLILNYGAYDASSMVEPLVKSETPDLLLTKDEMRWFWQQYLPNDESAKNPQANSLLNELRRIPPVYMVIADNDILYEENIKMLDKLLNSGVDVNHQVYEGTIHGFLESIRFGGIARTAINDTAKWLLNYL
jgi:acetyl esterase